MESALQCLLSATLSEAKQLHAYAIKTGVSTQNRTATKFISVYANHHHFPAAHRLLTSIPNPDIFCYTTLINAAVKSGRFQTALKVFVEMLQRRIFPDSRILPSAIKGCAGLSEVKLGKQVHGYGLASGLASDSLVELSLVHMYVKCNALSYARSVLVRMNEPDVVSWSALASGYAKKGDVDNANTSFMIMEKIGIRPNLISWNGVISGFNQSGRFSEAVAVFQRMHSGGLECDGVSISCALSAVSDLEDLIIGSQLHAYVIKLGLNKSDQYAVSSLLDMYGKCGCGEDVFPVFEEMDQKDVGTCNALVASLSRTGMVDEALRNFRNCQVEGMKLDVVSWTSMIACCTQHGRDSMALELFREMVMAGIEPNSVTIPSVLAACAGSAGLVHGKSAHGFSLKRGFCDDVYVCSSLIDMYSNFGRIEAAKRCFEMAPERNLVCWNAMIGGYAILGKAEEAIHMFHKMQRNGHKHKNKPDFVTFTSLLSACSHRGLVEEGKRYFNAMSEDHGIKPRMEHFACMVNLLGRTGKLEEAFSLIQEMPFRPDSCVWGALLSSCRVHHNTKLGELAANNLFALEPKNPGNYILLSNIYASKGKWSELQNVRDKMRSSGIRKNPGCSWIEVKNKIHVLLAGDSSHPQMKRILEKMSELRAEMKKAGFSGDAEFVLQDVEEQEKEHILCGHSEKLAVVFGILNTKPGTCLTVMKNLRICGDCHTSIKFISRFEGREIFVRDTNRFHHFKDGVCSCQDFW